MLDKNLIVGVYEDPDKLVSSVSKLRKKGVDIFDCYTPFPVHNLDREMGIKRSNLTVGAFLCGATGFMLGLLLQSYMMTDHLGTFKSWPMIIGGKPMDYHMIPSWIPVFFETTILCTAFGMAILFFIRAKMIHGSIADVMDPRQTSDRLFLAVEPGKLNIPVDEVNSIMMGEGALEIRERKNGEQQVVAGG